GLFRSWAKPTASVRPLPDIYSLASDETYRGGYLITEEPESPVMTLTVPLPKNNLTGDAAHLPVFGAAGGTAGWRVLSHREPWGTVVRGGSRRGRSSSR